MELAVILALPLVQLASPNSSLLSKRFVVADRNTPELSTNVAELARVWVTSDAPVTASTRLFLVASCRSREGRRPATSQSLSPRPKPPNVEVKIDGRKEGNKLRMGVPYQSAVDRDTLNTTLGEPPERLTKRPLTYGTGTCTNE